MDNCLLSSYSQSSDNPHLNNFKSCRFRLRKILREVEKWNNMFDMRATSFFPVRDEAKAMEEDCWVITDGRAYKPRPICFQCCGCLDFNWTPFYIHMSLTTRILITDSPNIRFAPDLPARNYCASQGISAIFIKVTVLWQMPNIYISNCTLTNAGRSGANRIFGESVMIIRVVTDICI
jgi:hypothetical protein